MRSAWADDLFSQDPPAASNLVARLHGSLAYLNRTSSQIERANSPRLAVKLWYESTRTIARLGRPDDLHCFRLPKLYAQSISSMHARAF
jgi:hypothetical protein